MNEHVANMWNEFDSTYSRHVHSQFMAFIPNLFRFQNLQVDHYGVASTSRLLKIIGLFCKRALCKRGYSAKETYNFKEPTNRSHPMEVPHSRRI